MYRKSVSRFRFENYKNLNKSMLFCVHSNYSKLYSGLKRDKKIKKNDIPCQVVDNKLTFRLVWGEYITYLSGVSTWVK